MTGFTLAASDYSLLTDLYQLTMVATYAGEDLAGTPASFELSVRRLPRGCTYLVAMGLAQVLEYLQQVQFTPQQIDYLKSLAVFERAPAAFWDLLSHSEFRGDVWAVPEGTVVFAQEPLLRIEAPLWQAQWLETCLLNIVNYQTLVATRASRLRQLVGAEIDLLEFGTRRAFSPQASLWAARSALAAGFTATSNVLAAQQLGVSPTGTMAHSLVMAIATLAGTEQDAFTVFLRYYPEGALLVDTYDTLAAVATLADRQAAGEIIVKAVRIDSGDLLSLSQKIRQLLPQTKIIASGDLDEAEVRRLKAANAPIDAYGIGTKLVSGETVNGVYKLVEINGQGVMKVSSGKMTLPGRKQIYRRPSGDCLALASEENVWGRPLLEPVMKAGRPLSPPESLATIRDRHRASLAELPETLLDVTQPVVYSPALDTLIQQLRHRP
ncbi:nicotinate phosphoribosyltransferase [Thermosynechococcus sp. QKsg1]|uniref:nicotinate phosphoribosyltransferase n=1 Tax=unclassified Thermosynechococcus TaxID=2622553 RepID=UPI00122E48F7|nr:MULTISPECIES: nicotinate phosphoribosyltransferase [unclassified Thermosynechococcus]QEQ01875.1 nicotinate phosphoribosyltransferase [Thermosynechococcus sp. CL-1]WJI23752.1 nicotinate phosphoribosyltransferase [Thermosynechococcus sp. B0]WJI26265.1 nicotinate phosphoribosyltransferase [Thermosynechococcus sp. B1]WKT83386.1 nicotinate phosphoribosyltransferase [Thermosynechococcus sp. HY596]WNC62516.1 nicotinate phosphoribosyltransferase [Thermosynechococcus sp. HY591]